MRQCLPCACARSRAIILAANFRAERKGPSGVALSYEIIGNDAEWRMRHGGKAENLYETKEAAFETAVAAASLALKQGHEVALLLPDAARSPDTLPAVLPTTTAPILARNSFRGFLDMSTGTVKWFNGPKGYGFIQPDGGGKDVFVHISAVEKAGLSGLREGAQVSFDVVADKGKESAENLRMS